MIMVEGYKGGIEKKRQTEVTKKTSDDLVGEEQKKQEALKDIKEKEIHENIFDTLKDNYKDGKFIDPLNEKGNGELYVKNILENKLIELGIPLARNQAIVNELMDIFIETEGEINFDEFGLYSSELIDKSKEKDEIHEITEKYIKYGPILNESLSKLNHNTLKNNGISKLINEFKEIPKNNKEKLYNGTVELLDELNKPGVLETVAIELKENNPEAYIAFETAIKNIDPALGFRLDALNSKNILQTNSAKYKNTPDGLEAKLDGKNNAVFDIKAKKDGERTLNLEGSKYSLELDKVNQNRLDEIDNVQSSLNEKLKPIDEALRGVERILLVIENGEENNLSFDEIKENIAKEEPELYVSLGIENYKDIDSLKSRLAGIYSEKEKEKQDQVDLANKELEAIVKAEFEANKLQVEAQKETLRIMNELFLDRIPKSILDQVINNINGNVVLLGKLGFGRKIDIKNGDLGVDKDNDVLNYTLQEKQILAKFLNKMLTGDINKPVSIDTTGIIYVNENGSKTRDFNMNLYIANKMNGINVVDSIMKNLYKSDEGNDTSGSKRQSRKIEK